MTDIHPMAEPEGQFLIYTGEGPLPLELRQCVIAIGNFDGVHRGHRGVIAQAQMMAQRLGKPCAVLTFEPHPSDFFGARPPIFRLTPLPAKAHVLEGLGLDGVMVLDFDRSLASLSREDFVRDILVDRLGVAGVVAGYDFHFGKNRLGTPGFLIEAGAAHGFETQIVPRITMDEQGSLAAVSSTAIRTLLEKGEVHAAAGLLGHHYFVLGPVIHGQKLGRTLGFPTANLALDPSNRLHYGIYAIWAYANDKQFKAVASYGRRPTVDNGPPLLEVLLFDFSGDLYGQTLRVEFAHWIRGEEKFDSLDALVVQMKLDCDRARELLASPA